MGNQFCLEPWNKDRLQGRTETEENTSLSVTYTTPPPPPPLPLYGLGVKRARYVYFNHVLPVHELMSNIVLSTLISSVIVIAREYT